MLTIKQTAPNSFKKSMNGLAKKQMPFAGAMALTRTAWDMKKKELDPGLDKHLDRPTPFTKKAIRVQKARKNHLVAYVRVAPLQARYLRYQVKGGTRRPHKKALLVPVGQRLNKYGNMPRSTVSKLMQNPKVFSGIPHGRTQPGIYKRLGPKGRKKLHLMVAYEKRASYEKRFHFYQLAERQAKRSFNNNLLAAKREARR
jgi:hypothetical protein